MNRFFQGAGAGWNAGSHRVRNSSGKKEFAHFAQQRAVRRR